MVCAGRAGRVCGRDEYHQFHGWDQWYYGRVCAGGAGAAVCAESDADCRSGRL